MSNTPENAIVHISPEYGFECPQTWDALVPTDDANVRHCAACQKDVALCATREDADALMEREPGACAAYPKPAPMPTTGEVEEVAVNRGAYVLVQLRRPQACAGLPAHFAVDFIQPI